MVNTSSASRKSFFRFRNHHPDGYAEKAMAATAVNAVAAAIGKDWTAAFHDLLDASHRLGMMPDDIKCVKEMLAANGFIQQPGVHVPGLNVEKMRAYMAEHCTGGVMAIVKTPQYGYGGQASAILPVTEAGQQTYVIVGHEDVSRSPVEDIWLRWPDNRDHSPNKRRTRSTTPRERALPEDRGAYRFHQENPRNNFTGDCVVRGIAAVCRLTWDETVDLLGESNRVMINYREVYTAFLKQRGFVYHSPLRLDGRCMTAAEFCEAAARLYPNGERILAQIGRSHVAAILPVTGPDGALRYEIMDTWNCSKKPVFHYFVQSPVSAESPSPRTPGKEMPDFALGERIRHPVFGAGTVVSLTEDKALAFMEVDFPKIGRKRLASSWAAEYCRRI